MTPDRDDSPSREERLQAVLHSYLQALDAGRPPDRAAFLADHPEFTAELADFLAAQDRLDSAARAMRPPAPPAAETLGAQQGPPAVGTTVRYFGDYELLDEVARGGMGVVYRARQVSLDRVVALKMILAGGHAGAADLERFFTEAKAVAQLQHANLVQLYESGEHEGLPYLTLEFVPGGSLADRLKGTPLPPREAARLVEQAARGVQYAHEKGIVHRDLKPANVLLAGDGTAKVTDFGLARRADGGAGLTATGAVLGTPSYMAPEQAAGRSKGVGPAADVYGLGAVLYECLTGRPPFQAPTPLDTLMLVLKSDPVSPKELQPQVPRDLETVCLKCLQKEPAKRYASAAALAEDLRRFQAGEPITARPVGRLERGWRWCRRNPAVAGLLGAVAAALLLGAAVATWFALEAAASAERADRKALDAEKAREGEAAQAKAEARARQDAETARKQADADRQRAERREAEARTQLERARRALCTAQLMRVAAVYERDPRLGLELLHDCNACPLDLRDFAWGWYEGRCRRQPQKATLQGHTGASVAFSPDGKLLASGSGGGVDGPGEVRLWEVATGREKFNLKGHGSPVRSAAFSPDGKLLASVGRGEVKLWDVATGQKRADLRGHTRPILCVAFSPDGKLLASGAGEYGHGGPGELKLWDVATGREKAPLKGHREAVYSVAFCPDGKLLASGGGEATKLGEVKLWEVASGREKVALQGHTYPVRSVAFSPDGKILASGTNLDGVRLWEVATGRLKTSLKEASSFSVAFSPDGILLASAGGGEVKFWDVVAGQEKATLKGFNGADSVAFSPDGRLLASGSASDKTIKLWDAATGQLKASLKGHAGHVNSVAFSPDGKTLASGAGAPLDLPGGEIKLWDMATGQEKTTLEGQIAAVRSVTFSADGKLFASGGDDGTVKLWEVGTGQEKATLTRHTGTAFVAFSPDGKTLASGGRDGIKLWDMATGQMKATLPGHARAVISVAFSSNGLLASGGLDRTVKLWDVETGREQITLKRHRRVSAVAFSPDGETLASGGEGLNRKGEVKLWEVATRRETATLKAHASQVMAVAFSPDGKLLASGGTSSVGADSGEVKIWDAATGQLKATLRGHARPVVSVAFSPDGETLASGSFDSTIRLWDVAEALRAGQQR
jgi:eukaryotic-like serine/threonine-protein kinase